MQNDSVHAGLMPKSKEKLKTKENQERKGK